MLTANTRTADMTILSLFLKNNSQIFINCQEPFSSQKENRTFFCEIYNYRLHAVNLQYY